MSVYTTTLKNSTVLKSTNRLQQNNSGRLQPYFHQKIDHPKENQQRSRNGGRKDKEE
jgi:hypothetical protein